ncbi:MAG: aminopeptidase P family protein [Phycisphaerales bacterium]|nr:aminopeptidase P family protein [Phycisphaerales bacterium]
MNEHPISNDEFEQRVNRVQELLASDARDAVLVFSTESEPAGVRYFSDYWPSFETAAVLIAKSGPAALLIGPESGTYARSRSRLENVIRMKDFRESSMPDYPGTTLASWQDVLRQFKVGRLGIAGWHMFPHAIMQSIQQVLGRENVSDADELVRQVTLIKSPAEQQCLKEAARLSELGFNAVLEKIRPGMTEIQLVGIATQAMMEAGAEATGYPIWCCSGPNSTQAISRPTHRKVQTGEIIHFSIGAKVAGYSASVGRPVVLGACPQLVRRFLNVGLEAENRAIDLMKAGTPASEVARKVHGFITDEGYGHTILYGPAHACGQMECEHPFVETSSTYVLEENMVFMVDVFLADKEMGFRWEDGVIIRNGGPEVLSSHRRQLNILEI